MARVTPAEVAAIMSETTDFGDVTPQITIANLTVTNVITDPSMSAAELKEIERWLSAHFIAVGDKSMTVKSEKADVVSQSFFGKLGLRLDNTKYGQQAIAADRSGALARLNDGKKAAATLHSVDLT